MELERHDVLVRIKEEAREYQLDQGILINLKPAPVALLPTRFPRRLFDLCVPLVFLPSFS